MTNPGLINSIVIFLGHIGVVFSVTCYKCSINQDGIFDNNRCRIPEDGVTPTIECPNVCVTEIVYTTTYATERDFSITRGCSDPCTTTLQSSGSYHVEKQCCSTDKCNSGEKPSSWLKCHRCEGDGVDSCLKDAFVSEERYVYCDGSCSKTFYDVFAQQTIERDCSTSCVEGVTDYGIQGQSEKWCCDTDLCNTGNQLVAMSVIKMAAIVVVLNTILMLYLL